VPTGPGNTKLQVRIASDLGATGYVGTPSFLYTILKKAAEVRSPLQIEVAYVTDEMLPESLRHELETDYGIRVLQGYVTADLGMLAYECFEQKGIHLHPEVIVEVLDLETGNPAPPGRPGQVVATIFDETYPLVRFATGDISTFLNDRPCACGRTTPKLGGILGRVGDAVKVKGIFVRGSSSRRWTGFRRSSRARTTRTACTMWSSSTAARTMNTGWPIESPKNSGIASRCAARWSLWRPEPSPRPPKR
jgi:phenylacetate-CoA ligase